MNDTAMKELKFYRCDICGYVYDPFEGDPVDDIAPETPFEKLPRDWKCPVCGAARKDFTKM